MAHKDWCGSPCADCKSPCKLDEAMPCSPDCKNLKPDGSRDTERCKLCGCDAVEERREKMKFKDFTDEQIRKALLACSDKKGKRCSSCPIFGKGFQGECVQLLMQRAARMLGENLISILMKMLPKQPRSFDTADDPGFWSNGDLILCPSECECEMVASFLEDALREVSTVKVLTGYFDPFEDGRNGENDDLTGFWYIDFE